MTRAASLRVLALSATLLFAVPALAVTPDEMLADPALEARARAISAELRCLVCQNQSIDDSDADLAADLRRLVRERLLAGDTDEQVIDYLVDRYGEFVLLKPRLSSRNLLLWAAPILALLVGGVFVAVAVKRRRTAPAALSEEERAALEALLKRDDG